jgi:hypothetical protein
VRNVSEQKRILLYGNSVVIGCIGASLERAGKFEITRLSAPSPDRSQLDALCPDVILFDAENGRPEPAFSLLEKRLDLLLVSIDPDGNLVRLWSGRQYRELTTTDLTALIEAGSNSEAVSDEHSSPQQPDKG